MPSGDLPLPMQIADLVLFIGSLFVWAIVVRRLRRGVPIIPHEPRRPVPWQGVDLVIVLLAFILVAGLAQQAFLRPHENQPSAEASSSTATPRAVEPADAPDQKVGAHDHALSATDLTVETIIKLLTMAIAIGWVTFRVCATPRDLGFDLTHFPSDLVLGIATYLATIVPINLLQWVLESTRIRPYDHPLIKAFRENPGVPMLAVCGVAAVVIAPLFEEFCFRVLMQGCLEAVEVKRRLLLDRATRSARMAALPPPTIPGSAGPTGDPNPDRSPAAVDRSAVSEADVAAASGPAAWPILVASALFALMHWAYGLSSIPLFFFALALGYVYQRTHRIWPSLVGHLLLNGTSMATLWYLLTNPTK